LGELQCRIGDCSKEMVNKLEVTLGDEVFIGNIINDLFYIRNF